MGVATSREKGLAMSEIELKFSSLFFLGSLVWLSLFVVINLYQRQGHNKVLDWLGGSGVRRLMPGHSLQKMRWALRCELLAGFFLLLALARPQGASREESQSLSTGKEVFFVVDISNSMRASDVAPSRLDAVRSMIRASSETLIGSRVGLVVFAEQALTVVPLTNDLDYLLSQVNEMTPEWLTAQGTSLKNAVTTMAESLTRGLESRDSPRRAVIFTDAEEVNQDQVNDSSSAAAMGSLDRIELLWIGVGTEEGGNIPENPSADAPQGWKVDSTTGERIITKVHPEVLKKLASEYGGESAVYANAYDGIDTVVRFLEKGNPNETRKRSESIRAREEYFWIPLMLSIFLLVLSNLFRLPRSISLEQRKVFTAIFFLSGFLFFSNYSSAVSIAPWAHSEISIYCFQLNFSSCAENQARIVQRLSPLSPAAFINEGIYLFINHNESDALNRWIWARDLAQVATKPELLAVSYYNIATSKASSSLTQEAIQLAKSLEAIKKANDQTIRPFIEARLKQSLAKMQQQEKSKGQSSPDKNSKGSNGQSDQEQPEGKDSDPSRPKQLDRQSADQVVQDIEQNDREARKRMMQNEAKGRRSNSGKDW